jgi:hypothetical protein
MAQVFSFAESVERIATNLIPAHHPELATARIKYVFQEKAGKKGGKTAFGSAKKLSGVSEFLLEADFLITVGLDVWNNLPDTQRLALVDHLLERCTGVEDDEDGGTMKWTTREPDVHEFASILQRHGTWNDDLSNFMSVANAVNVDDVEVDHVTN